VARLAPRLAALTPVVHRLVLIVPPLIAALLASGGVLGGLLGRPKPVRPWFGNAFFHPRRAVDPGHRKERADTAFYEAERRGKNHFRAEGRSGLGPSPRPGTICPENLTMQSSQNNPSICPVG
jgi:hypothetical protein